MKELPTDQRITMLTRLVSSVAEGYGAAVPPTALSRELSYHSKLEAIEQLQSDLDSIRTKIQTTFVSES